MAIVSFAFAMFILGDPLTCGKAPPAPPDNGILTWNETEVVKSGTRAIYDCLPGYRSITIRIIHVEQSLHLRMRDRKRDVETPYVKECNGRLWRPDRIVECVKI